MGNSKTKKIIITIISIILLAGLLLVVLPFFISWIQGTAFAGILLILSGSIMMFELKRLEELVKSLGNKLLSALRNEAKAHLYFFLSIFISAIVFRIIYITKPVNYSEALIILNYINSKTFQQLFFYSSPDNFILNNIFIKLLAVISNQELWVLRIPSLIAGILIIPFIYIAVRLFYNKHAAILASSIIAALPLFINYSADMRGISLMILLFLILLITARYIKQHDDIAVWLFASLISALGFLNSPLFFLPFMTVSIWLFLSTIFKDTSITILHILKRLLFFFSCTFMLTFLMYIPVVITSGYLSLWRHMKSPMWLLPACPIPMILNANFARQWLLRAVCRTFIFSPPAQRAGDFLPTRGSK